MVKLKYIALPIFAALTFLSCMTQKNLEPMQSMRDMEYFSPTKFAELPNGIEIAYVDEGHGDQTIIFIHGLGSYLPSWKKNIESLRENYRCIALDLPGYGRSSKGNYEGSMTFFAGTIVAFMDALGIERAVWAGHSMGGQIAIVAALGYPERVEKLILAAPAGFETFHKGQKQWFREVYTVDLVKNTSVEQIRSNFVYNFYRMPEDAGFMIKDRIEMRSAEDFPAYCFIIPQSVMGMVDEPVYDYLPLIKQPVLVVFGEYDNLIPNRYLNGGKTEIYAKDGASRIPGAKLVMVPNAGHFVHFEKHNIFNEEVRKFLE